jgi:hypothetical protein
MALMIVLNLTSKDVKLLTRKTLTTERSFFQFGIPSTVPLWNVPGHRMHEMICVNSY